MRAHELPWIRIAALAAVAAVVAAIAVVVRTGQGVPDEVQAIAWNREPCAHCQMLLGEPRHAAQLVSTDGDVRSFDDPGCALRYIAERDVAVHRLWFHHGGAERWLAADDAAFETGAVTPMGSGLLAVERGTPGAIDLEAARARALARRTPDATGHGAATHGGAP